MPEVLTQSETPVPEHVIEFIYEEMEARGWDEWELARRMGGDPSHNKLSLEILDACREVDVLLGEDGAEQIGRAFGTGAQIWLNLDKTWRDHKRTALERSRLERAIVDAVMREDRKGMLTPWIADARNALIEFESQQIKK